MFEKQMLNYAHKTPPQPENVEKKLSYTSQSCGDSVELLLGETAGANVDGCLVCRASTNKLCEAINTDGIKKFQEMEIEDFLDFLGWDLTPMREECAVTPLKTLQTQ